LSFFFSSRRRHTISKRDWSSDVCSSDLRRYWSCDKTAFNDFGSLITDVGRIASCASCAPFFCFDFLLLPSYFLPNVLAISPFASCFAESEIRVESVRMSVISPVIPRPFLLKSLLSYICLVTV